MPPWKIFKIRSSEFTFPACILITHSVEYFIFSKQHFIGAFCQKSHKHTNLWRICYDCLWIQIIYEQNKLTTSRASGLASIVTAIKFSKISTGAETPSKISGGEGSSPSALPPYSTPICLVLLWTIT